MRRKCTADNPYTPERGKNEPGYGWEHDNVYEVSDQESLGLGCDVVKVRCRNCGIEWVMELPQ